MITGQQIRDARQLLRWAPSDLAHRTGLNQRTIERAESTPGEPAITISHATTIRTALERAGIAFDPGAVRLASIRPTAPRKRVPLRMAG